MKASPKSNTKTAAKPAAKAAANQKTLKMPVAKPVAKKAAKPVAKPVAKKVAKPVAKPVAKKATKPAPKPVAKKAAQVAAKPVAKPVGKAPAKPAVQAVTPKAAKAAALPVTKPVAAPTSPAVAWADATRKFTGRAAKAAAGVPPPPSTIPFSNPAKASFGPDTEIRMPTLVPVIPKKDPKLANNWKKKPVEELTDEEVLSMSDNDYMNDTQMAFFRLKLQALKRDILANAGETTEHLREDTVIVPDPADRATIEEEHSLELRTRDRERKLLKKIEQSIQRIDQRDYGYCDETGEPIGVARLLARPTATLSLEAQQRRELKQKMFGD
ncbi:MAG: RNA polymerase-binding protein DksA [Alphaproteobacteria bacterium]|nr:RNA polymerase-binding protein DksA [Alphaproteobacteria bacterium]MDI9329910.1 RNA polymerase-binding protein DksA [Alphaproteobacteria bacterium]